MTKPALVFLCQRIPYPPIKGERITSFNLLRHLVRHYRVYVGTFIDDPIDRAEIPKLRAMVEDLHVDEIRRPWAFANALPRWLAGEPVSFALFRSSRLKRWLNEIEAAHKPVAIVTHSSNISAYAVDYFRRPAGAEPRRILHFADVDSEKFVAYAAGASGPKRWFFAEEARRVRREERRLTAGSDAVAFVSDEEAALFRTAVVGDATPVVTLPNGVDIDQFDPERKHAPPFESQGAAIVFTGAMDYFPNIQAVTWFVNDVLPGVRKQIPNAQFLIVGSKPSPAVQRLAAEPGVSVTGRVESVAAYLEHAQLAVAPLMIARGIQNKVLEAMSMAMPILVSPGALTGIAATPGVHLERAETAAEWIEQTVALLREPERAAALGRAARALVLEHYTWEAQFARLDKLLDRRT